MKSQGVGVPSDAVDRFQFDHHGQFGRFAREIALNGETAGRRQPDIDIVDLLQAVAGNDPEQRISRQSPPGDPLSPVFSVMVKAPVLSVRVDGGLGFFLSGTNQVPPVGVHDDAFRAKQQNLSVRDRFAAVVKHPARDRRSLGPNLSCRGCRVFGIGRSLGS